jgi:hypothetical protein
MKFLDSTSYIFIMEGMSIIIGERREIPMLLDAILYES